jgi:hypothetical protein
MFRQLTTLLAYASILFSTWAEEGWLFSRMSPDLQKFMVAHPGALTVLSNAFSQSFSNRSVGVFYFYSTNEAEARAAHYYPGAGGAPEVFICVQENQYPIGQFITLLFEILNARNERQFKNLFEDAYNGSVSKKVFVATIGHLEFARTLETRALLMPLHFSRKEIKQSDYYERLLNCPTNYAGFLAYEKVTRSKRDPDKFYEAEYDQVRKLNPASKGQNQPNAESEHHRPETSTPSAATRP